jgi:hypothetical protein
MNHQCAQIPIAAFADAEQADSSTTGSLLRHQAKTGQELTAVLEEGSIAHSGDQGCCRHRADTFDLPKPPAVQPYITSYAERVDGVKTVENHRNLKAFLFAQDQSCLPVAGLICNFWDDGLQGRQSWQSCS